MINITVNNQLMTLDVDEQMPLLLSGGADATVKAWKLSAKPSSSGRSSFSFLKEMRGHDHCIVAIRADLYKVCMHVVYVCVYVTYVCMYVCDHSHFACVAHRPHTHT